MSEKRYQPTTERLKKAHGEGKNQRSQLFSGSFLFLSVVYGICHILGNNWVRIRLLVECLWSQEFTNAGECGRVAVGQFSQFLNIFFVGICVLSASIGWLQLGRVWVPAALVPDGRRIAPAKGLLKIGSGLASLPGTVLKGVIALAGMALLLCSVAQSLSRYRGFYISQQSGLLISDLQWFLKMAAAGFLCFGITELFLRRRQFRQQVYMDHEQMKREYRETEGDPHMRAHRRALHQALAREEMIRQIKKSRVILVERAIPSGAQ